MPDKSPSCSESETVLCNTIVQSLTEVMDSLGPVFFVP